MTQRKRRFVRNAVTEGLQISAATAHAIAGHYRAWIRLPKGGDPSCSNFNVAGPFTEWILLGVLVLRFEGKLAEKWGRLLICGRLVIGPLIIPNS